MPKSLASYITKAQPNYGAILNVSLKSFCSSVLQKGIIWGFLFYGLHILPTTTKKLTLPRVKNMAFLLMKKYKQSIFNKQQILTVQNDFLYCSDLPVAHHWGSGNCPGLECYPQQHCLICTKTKLIYFNNSWFKGEPCLLHQQYSFAWPPTNKCDQGRVQKNAIPFCTMKQK